MADSLIVGRLRALFTADTAEFEAGLRRASGAAADVSKGFATTQQNIQRAAGAIGTAFASLQIGQQAREAAERMDEISDAAKRMGIGAEAVQRLSFAAEQGGASISSVGTAIKFMADVLGNEKQAAKLMGELGLSLEEIKAMSPDQAFVAIADAIGRIPNPLERSDAATDAFGRGALELMPAIVAGFTEVGNAAPVMADKIVESGARSADELDKIRLKFDNLKAQALLPLVDVFTRLPESVQVAVAGISQFFPSLETLTLGILALGGPKGAITILGGLLSSMGGWFLTLGGTITGFLSGAGAMLLSFFTTTLPAAFTAIITFLGPQGLIAVAVIALGLIWYKWGEDIKRIVSQLYTAIRDWLGAKLTAVFDGIKAKIEAVKGWFKGLYDSVVGHSTVPDLINGIAAWFGKLYDVMVQPAAAAVSATMAEFEKGKDATRSWQDSISELSRAFEQLATIAGESLSSIVRGIGSVISSVRTGIEGVSAFRAGLGALGAGNILSGLAGVVSGIGGIVGAAIAGFNAVRSLVNGIRSLFGTDEEARDVNPARDAWFQEMFGAGAGEQYQAIVDALAEVGITGEEAAQLISGIYQADTMAEFQAAIQAVENAMRDAGREGDESFRRSGDAAEATTNAIYVTTESVDALGQTTANVTAMMVQSFTYVHDVVLAVRGAVLALSDSMQHVMDGASALGSVGGGSTRVPGVFPSIPENTWGYMHDGGVVGRDEVNIRALSGEGVLSRMGMANLGGAAMLDALNSGTARFGGSGGNSVTLGPGAVVVNGAGKNGKQLAYEIAQYLPDAIIRVNPDGARNKLRRGLA